MVVLLHTASLLLQPPKQRVQPRDIVVCNVLRLCELREGIFWSHLHGSLCDLGNLLLVDELVPELGSFACGEINEVDGNKDSGATKRTFKDMNEARATAAPPGACKYTCTYVHTHVKQICSVELLL